MYISVGIVDELWLMSHKAMHLFQASAKNLHYRHSYVDVPCNLIWHLAAQTHHLGLINEFHMQKFVR